MACPRSVSESPAEQGGVSKRPAGPSTEGTGKSSFTLTQFAPLSFRQRRKVRECDGLED